MLFSPEFDVVYVISWEEVWLTAIDVAAGTTGDEVVGGGGVKKIFCRFR